MSIWILKNMSIVVTSFLEMYMDSLHGMDISVLSAEFEWGGLVSAMSGLLCAHLNAIGPKSTYNPLYSFKPQGVVLGEWNSKGGTVWRLVS